MALFSREMQARRLHNSDIKKIVRVLRSGPPSASSHEKDSHEKATEAAIKKLPRRLRSSPLSSHGALCCTHKGLDAHLIDDIWSWIKYELEIGIGRFLYLIIMSDILSEPDKLRARQLEPVVRMFKPNWTLAKSSPPRTPPIDAGDKWVYQKNGCPACMLARIGSDEDALFALFAGMCGRHRWRSGGQKGVDKLKSRRLRFVRYWMRTLEDGEQKTSDAYDLGVKLKTLRREAKIRLRRSGQPTQYTRDSIDGVPVVARHCLDGGVAVAVGVEDPVYHKDWTINTLHDPEIGPTLPLDANSQTQSESWDSKPHFPLPQINTLNSPQSLRGDTLSPLPPAHHDAMPTPSPSIYSTRSHAPSTASFIHSTHSTHSRTTLTPSPASHTPWPENRFDPFETPDERVRKYREILARTGVVA
ncbi:hypothetical protein M3J09_007570 [Ascochyta lentis]